MPISTAVFDCWYWWSHIARCSAIAISHYTTSHACSLLVWLLSLQRNVFVMASRWCDGHIHWNKPQHRGHRQPMCDPKGCATVWGAVRGGYPPPPLQPPKPSTFSVRRLQARKQTKLTRRTVTGSTFRAVLNVAVSSPKGKGGEGPQASESSSHSSRALLPVLLGRARFFGQAACNLMTRQAAGPSDMDSDGT